VKSSVDEDCQLKLDSLGSTQPVEADKSVCDVSRAMKVGDRPSSSVEDGLKPGEYRSYICRVVQELQNAS